MNTRLAASMLGVLLLAPAADAYEVEGVRLPEQVVVQDTPLVLNGAGVRWYLLFKVYVGALYLQAPVATTEAIIQAEAPKCIYLYFLRDVGAADITGALHRGFRMNATEAAYAQLRERIEQFLGAVPDLRAGDRVRLELARPDRTDVWVNDSLVASFPGRDFQAAALKVWLGDHPTDERLKQALLGNE